VFVSLFELLTDFTLNCIKLCCLIALKYIAAVIFKIAALAYRRESHWMKFPSVSEFAVKSRYFDNFCRKCGVYIAAHRKYKKVFEWIYRSLPL